MNEYRSKTTGLVLIESEIRAAYPNTSFPIPFVAPDEYDVVFPSPEPIKSEYQSAVRDGVEQDSKGNWVWAWKIIDWTDEQIAEHEATKAANALVAAKAERQTKVDTLIVTTQAGNTYDGDEVSQGRMARAIIGMQTQPGITISWVLADNSIVSVTVAELTEALALSGLAQAAIWTEPYDA